MKTAKFEYVSGYTAYLFRHIHLGFQTDIESIKVKEQNLEMILDRKTGTAYAIRFNYPIEIAVISKYFGNWKLTIEGRNLDEYSQERLEMVCLNTTCN